MAEEVVYDLDGYEVVTRALMELINQYPGLAEGDEISFTGLGESKGKAMLPTGGSVILTETKDITGHITQVCVYPFTVYYRASGLSESRKIIVKEWLDDLGRWLEKQTIKVGGTSYRLTEYPPLTDEREFKDISRTTPAYLSATNDNGSEDWTILLSATYQNEFEK